MSKMPWHIEVNGKPKCDSVEYHNIWVEIPDEERPEYIQCQYMDEDLANAAVERLRKIMPEGTEIRLLGTVCPEIGKGW